MTNLKTNLWKTKLMSNSLGNTNFTTVNILHHSYVIGRKGECIVIHTVMIKGDIVYIEKLKVFNIFNENDI